MPRPLTAISRDSLGDVWLEVASQILESGEPSRYDGADTIELLNVSITALDPSPTDKLIETLGDQERLAWMHANFTDFEAVAELGAADSYATRLYDYEHSGHNQVKWLIEKLRADPTCRSATVTMLQPRSDTTYIPCVSLLDVYLDEGALELVAYCHSIDFGTKGYANLVELAAIAAHIAAELLVPVGAVTMLVKSAHIYAPERSAMTTLTKKVRTDDDEVCG